MSFTTTRPSDDAVAGLDPADRALLSLALTWGLDDARIAELTGVDLTAVRARRERVFAAVAAQLGILPGEVPAAVRAPVVPAAAPADERPPGLTSPPPRPLPPPPPLAVHAPTGPPRVTATPSRPRTRTRTRRRWEIVASVAGLIALGLIVLVIAGRSTRQRGLRIRPATVARATPSPTRTAAHTPGPVAQPPVTATRTAALHPLPSGPRHTFGTLTLHRHQSTLTLDFRVSLPPLARHAHYEAYLYDSILRARSLGRVSRHGITRLRLPADAAFYRDIDVSDQPRGQVNPSGESRLRGPNPARDYLEPARRGSRSRAPSTR